VSGMLGKRRLDGRVWYSCKTQTRWPCLVQL